MKKSLSREPLPGSCPVTMRCALETIMLSAAWRKISRRRIVGTTPEAITPPSTLPAPTLGSWSSSPTIMILHCGLSASSRLSNSITSTMLISSITTTSHFSRFFSLWIKRTVSLFV